MIKRMLPDKGKKYAFVAGRSHDFMVGIMFAAAYTHLWKKRK